MNERIRDGVYHRETGLPALPPEWRHGEYRLIYSHHAKLAFVQNRFFDRTLRPPQSLRLRPENVVEAEVSAGRVSKIVARVPFSDRYDLVLALINPETGSQTVMVKTVWLNDVLDIHKTLNKNRYIPLHFPSSGV